MDAVPGLTLSLIAVFPGIMLYCAVYDVFCRRNNVVSTVPRDPKSVEALAVIVLGSVAVHLTAVIISEALVWPCLFDLCKQLAPVPVRTGEAILMHLVAGGKGSAREIEVLALTTLVLGLIAYGLADRAMIVRARRQKLPYWLYRWTATVAVSSERHSAIMIAYVLTDIEVGDKRAMYVGVVDDLALDDKFNVQRIVLVECNRYLIDLALDHDAFGSSLSGIPKIILDCKTILNVSFERIDLDG